MGKDCFIGNANLVDYLMGESDLPQKKARVAELLKKRSIFSWRVREVKDSVLPCIQRS